MRLLYNLDDLKGGEQIHFDGFKWVTDAKDALHTNNRNELKTK